MCACARDKRSSRSQLDDVFGIRNFDLKIKCTPHSLSLSRSLASLHSCLFA